jgi:hypothetical protein
MGDDTTPADTPENAPDATSDQAPSDTRAAETAQADPSESDAAGADLSGDPKVDRPVDAEQNSAATTEDAPANVEAAVEQQDTTTGSAATEVAAPAPAPAPERRGGFFPVVLGGAVAAGLGYGAHYLQSSQQPAPRTGAEIAALQAELADLRATVAELPAPGASAPQSPDLSDLTARIAALESSDASDAPDLSEIEGAVDGLRVDIAALPDIQAQLDDLSGLTQVDLGPVEDEIAALASRIAPVPDQIAALQAEMADLRTLATEEVAQAEAAVDAALAQAGLDRIAAALVTGAPFDAATIQLTEAGIDVPDALATPASDGVPTVESLQDGYGEAARAAIAASLQTAPAESATEKLGNFFRAQVGARSLAPREGDDPDAITSRAAVAVAEGDLSAALDELSALPEAGLGAMDDWVSAVQTRLNAVAALDALQTDMMAN